MMAEGRAKVDLGGQGGGFKTQGPSCGGGFL